MNNLFPNGNELYFAKVKEDARIPSKRTEDAGYDIYACFSGSRFVIGPHKTELVPTGIASAITPDYYLQVEERGSTGSKGIKKSAGVIDSGYRGEIMIAITNTNDVPVVITKTYDSNGKPIDESDWTYVHPLLYPYDKAIAQLIVHPVPQMDVKEISYDNLKTIPSERGDGLLGSSNK